MIDSKSIFKTFSLKYSVVFLWLWIAVDEFFGFAYECSSNIDTVLSSWVCDTWEMVRDGWEVACNGERWLVMAVKWPVMAERWPGMAERWSGMRWLRGDLGWLRGYLWWLRGDLGWLRGDMGWPRGVQICLCRCYECWWTSLWLILHTRSFLKIFCGLV